ncbi:hypothetical protein BMETH_505_0 [methanotrophic bacterial endosymbiont of Bathymodiolus sp.]|nr:hypothetical protein BMETH_505_0 [methanotrophic bacterial endosymbiont of Bathymodiolus sp.]
MSSICSRWYLASSCSLCSKAKRYASISSSTAENPGNVALAK